MKGGQYKPIEAEGFRNKITIKERSIKQEQMAGYDERLFEGELQSDGWVCERSREAWMGMQGP